MPSAAGAKFGPHSTINNEMEDMDDNDDQAGDNESMVKHFDDKERICSKCGSTVIIPHNQIGGFWHLSGFVADDGSRHYGGHCDACFNAVRAMLPNARLSGPAGTAFLNHCGLSAGSA